MLEIRKVTSEELQGKVDFSSIDLNNTIFILENDNVLGYASYELFDTYGMLKEIHLTEGNEILKDGLIRSVLNMMDFLKINYFVLENDVDEKLYRRIGFKDLEENNIFELDKDKYLYINISEFFNSSCQCSCGK